MSDPTDTMALLNRWHGGDAAALNELMQRHLPWVRERVVARLGAALRRRADVDDIVQQAMVDVLRHGPRFVVGDQEHYRALLLRIVENTIRKQVRFARQDRRDIGREASLPSSAVLDLSAGITRPSMAADRNESRAWVQLGLELLDLDDREVILRRQWEGWEFARIAAHLGVSEDAARMRFNRALARLAQTIKRVRDGRVQAALDRVAAE